MQGKQNYDDSYIYSFPPPPFGQWKDLEKKIRFLRSEQHKPVLLTSAASSYWVCKSGVLSPAAEPASLLGMAAFEFDDDDDDISD